MADKYKLVDLGMIIQIQDAAGTVALASIYRRHEDKGEAIELAKNLLASMNQDHNKGANDESHTD